MVFSPLFYLRKKLKVLSLNPGRAVYWMLALSIKRSSMYNPGQVSFKVEAFSKHCLVNEFDAIQFTMEKADKTTKLLSRMIMTTWQELCKKDHYSRVKGSGVTNNEQSLNHI
ncbi:hypothetical protein BDB01DRAFT_897485 [Pilobolus umbonatus]|nr:hypothetical protein BDB01DRAFT_897485 [Pilobolus umbonatus]